MRTSSPWLRVNPVRRGGRVLLAVGALVASFVFATPSATAASVKTKEGPSSATWHLNVPTSLALYGSDLFVANFGESGAGSNTIDEINTTTGALVRVISGAEYKFNTPYDITVDGDDVFAVNTYYKGPSITEFNASTGALVRVITSTEDLTNLSDLAFIGPALFATDDSSLVEINATTGNIVRVISGSSYDFDGNGSIVKVNSDVFLANYYNDSVTEVNATNGDLVRVIKGSSYDLDYPYRIAAVGQDLFVLNSASVTEIDADTGSLVRVIKGSNYEFSSTNGLGTGAGVVFVGSEPRFKPSVVTMVKIATGGLITVVSGAKYDFGSPDAFLFHGTDVYVSNGSSNTVTEFNVDTRSVVRVLKGS